MSNVGCHEAKGEVMGEYEKAPLSFMTVTSLLSPFFVLYGLGTFCGTPAQSQCCFAFFILICFLLKPSGKGTVKSSEDIALYDMNCCRVFHFFNALDTILRE